MKETLGLGIGNKVSIFKNLLFFLDVAYLLDELVPDAIVDECMGFALMVGEIGNKFIQIIF